MKTSRLALVSLSLTTLMASLDTSIANSGLPAISKALNASFQSSQWIVLAYLLTITSLVVPAGRAADFFGRRRLLITGIASFTVASAACGLAPSIEWLIAARAVQGLGAALMMALTLALAKEVAIEGKTGSAIGLLGTMSAVGTALGPTLGGLLIAYSGWPAIYLVNLPIGMINIALVLRAFGAEPPTMKRDFKSFGLPSVIFLTVALAVYSASMTVGHGHWSYQNGILLGMAVAMAAIFSSVDRRQPLPLLNPKVLNQPTIASGLIASGLVSAVIMSTIVVGPYYLAQALHLNAIQAGLVLSVGPIVVAAIGFPAGRLADRFGAQTIQKLGLVQVGLGCLVMASIPWQWGIVGYIAALAIVTSGYAFFQTANNALVMATAHNEDRGLVSGGLNLSRNLGLITGTSVMGAIYSAAASTGDATVASSLGLRATFTVGMALALSALIAVRRSERRSQPSSLRENRESISLSTSK